MIQVGRSCNELVRGQWLIADPSHFTVDITLAQNIKFELITQHGCLVAIAPVAVDC